MVRRRRVEPPFMFFSLGESNMSHLMNTYARLPVSFTHGEGVWLWDTAGKRYLDALAGVAVNGLGHAHGRLVRDLQAQVAQLIHTSNIYAVTLQETLADRLAELSGMDKVFFANSGAEANEAAIKIARLYGHRRGVDKPSIIVTEKSFHGRTMATLTATGNTKVQVGFEPLVEGFIRVPYDDLPAIEAAIAENPDVVAILVEPVQGEGGINVPALSYLQGIRALCDRHELLMMLDEVQTGIGRTGTWFAFQHAGIVPDVMSLAKGLGSGVPIGACVARGIAAETFQPGNHGSTFGGNPLACRAALTTLDVMADEHLLDHATQMGEFIGAQLRQKCHDLPLVKAVRGIGLMIGIELDRPCGELVKLALADGLLINVTAERVIRLVPPLVIQPSEAMQLVDGLVSLLRRFAA